MGNRTCMLRAVAGSLALTLLSCDKAPDSLSPSLATAPSCTISFTYIGSKTLTVQANSKNNDAGWFINNDGTTAVTINGQTVSKSGNIAAVRAINWASFPATLGPGTRIDADLFFDAGAAGTGSVGMSITTSCGTKTLPIHPVVIQAASGGVPFGPSDLFETSGSFRQVAPFTWTTDGTDSAQIITQINTARNNHIKFALVMTGGGSGNYVTNGKFDFVKWKARQNTFNTAAIKSAVAAGVSDGTIPFAVLIDEPNRADWGGNVHHSTLDSMSRHTKSIFPSLRTGVDVTHTWENTVVYQSVDIMTTQFAGTEKSGDVNTYRTQAVASAARQKVALFFSINIINGGKKPVNGSCPSAQTTGSTEGGQLKGCKMTGAEMQSYGDALLQAPEACGLKMWKYDLPTLTPTGDLMTLNRAAFDHLAATAKAHAAKPCVKPA
jgi:hypothetical protein